MLTVWKNAGYYMLFILAGLQAIPDEAKEAALLDGAGPWQRLLYVTLPALRPTFAFVGVIALLNAVTQVDHVFVLTKGGPSDATKLLLFYIYEQAAERYDAGRAAAATVVTLGLLAALTAFSLARVRARRRPDERHLLRPGDPRGHAAYRPLRRHRPGARLGGAVLVDAGRGVPAGGIGGGCLAPALPDPDARQLRRGLGLGRFSALLPQFARDLRRHPRGAARHASLAGYVFARLEFPAAASCSPCSWSS